MARKSAQVIAAEKEMAKFDINYADRHDVADRAKNFCTEVIIAAKTGRSAKEEEWLEDLRIWSCQLTDASMYLGRSNLVIPEMHKQVESSVDQFQSGLFPNDDYIGVIPENRTSKDEALDIKDAVFHELDHKNNLPAISERFQRQKVLYGTAFYKPIFEKKMKTVYAKDEKGYPKISQVPQFQGVRVHVKDTFHTYVWPEDSVNEQEAEAVFDEMFLPKRNLEKEGIYKNLDKVAETLKDFAYGMRWVDTVRLTIANLASATSYRPTGVLIHEVWCDFDIVKGEYVPCVITIANMSTVIRVQRNPFWHQLKPYCMGRYVEAPSGELYGHSLSERLRSLQYMMSDLGNQTMDSLTYSLNPIALIDPGFAGDVNSFKLQPGARWFASPQGVQFAVFPDVSQSGLAGMAQVRQMIQQFSDLAPQVAPQLSGKARSATQVMAVQNELTEGLKNKIRSDEYNVMTQLCFMTHQLLRQFQDAQYQVVTQGPEKGQWILKPIRPAVLQKDVVWTWRGSSVSQKSAVRNQQILSAFNMAVQMESIMPGTVDLPELYKHVLYETFDLKDLGIYKKDKETQSVAPDIENLALLEGEDVDVHLGDNYEEHMASHEESLKKADIEAAKLAFLRHIEQHRVQYEAKKVLQAQQAKLMALQATGQMGAESGDEPTYGREGNPNQMSSSANPANIAQGVRAIEPNTPRVVRRL